MPAILRINVRLAHLAPMIQAGEIDMDQLTREVTHAVIKQLDSSLRWHQSVEPRVEDGLIDTVDGFSSGPMTTAELWQHVAERSESARKNPEDFDPAKTVTVFYDLS